MKHQNLFYRITARVMLVCVANLLAIAPSHALDIPASLHWSKRVELATPVSGIIKSVMVNSGDKVEKDTILLKLDDRQYAAALSQARARVKDLSERRIEAKRELDRALELYDRTVLSDHDLQTAKNAKLAADSDYEAAKAELVTAELNLEYASIRAPFKALVLQRNAEIGQTVVSQLKPETLVILAAAGEMLARGYIEQGELNGPVQGDSATIVVAGKPYNGKVKHVGLEPVKRDKQGVYYEIDIMFNTGDRILRAGQQATINYHECMCTLLYLRTSTGRVLSCLYSGTGPDAGPCWPRQEPGRRSG